MKAKSTAVEHIIKSCNGELIFKDENIGWFVGFQCEADLHKAAKLFEMLEGWEAQEDPLTQLKLQVKEIKRD